MFSVSCIFAFSESQRLDFANATLVCLILGASGDGADRLLVLLLLASGTRQFLDRRHTRLYLTCSFVVALTTFALKGDEEVSSHLGVIFLGDFAHFV